MAPTPRCASAPWARRPPSARTSPTRASPASAPSATPATAGTASAAWCASRGRASSRTRWGATCPDGAKLAESPRCSKWRAEMRTMLKSVVLLGCLAAVTAWAADRDISLKEGERRSFKLPGIAQVAIDDASVVEGTAKGDQLNVAAKAQGSARILVLLKRDQWVTFKVKVLPGDVAAGPVPESLPDAGEPIYLRVGEKRAFETPGIQKMPMGGPAYEAKVSGKQLE